MKCRGVLLFSKMIALSVFTLVAMALDVIVQCMRLRCFYMEQNSRCSRLI
ncbi:MAG: hypothetical protein ACLRI8_10945 [Agathobacter rectalis]